MIEQMKNMKQSLMACVQNQLGDLKSVDAKELGEAVDMIKDFSEAIYYCTITEAMEKSDKEKEGAMKYTYPPVMYNGGNMGMNDERMYYDGGMKRIGNDRMYYTGKMEKYPTSQYSSYNNSYPTEMRDYREGKSPITRRMYMESKELHHDKSKQMKELEDYMEELSHDIMEMISDSTPEEKIILSQKLNTLAGKIK